MIRVYYLIVKRNLKTIDQIPKEYQEEVKRLLEEDGIV